MNDQLTLIPLFERMEDKLGVQYKDVTLDAGYESEENYTWFLLRMNRSIQSEGTFGIIKQDMGFRRFLTHGKKNIFTEMLLMAIGFNINKWHNKISNNRSGSLLFEKQIA